MLDVNFLIRSFRYNHTRHPYRLNLEQHQTEDNHFPALTASELPLGGSMNVHSEILAGTDESIDVRDFMTGGMCDLTLAIIILG